ncbi:hypothetical protein F442_00263 [Phytophthora nicotianae P10297]|uniref:Uncharacterized protein n=1 Tax=Phytophthora nicotianae P10297 TaxID=1317064 RepID=W3A7G8_PHYNI|nr:hypothetical protein F442_00263 [Phytophthora nicotianae P10297]
MEGLKPIGNSWEPFKIMHEDIKVLVCAYADKSKDNKLFDYHNLLRHDLAKV